VFSRTGSLPSVRSEDYPFSSTNVRKIFYLIASASTAGVLADPLPGAVAAAYLYDAWGNHRELDVTDPANPDDPLFDATPDLGPDGLYAWESYLANIQSAYDPTSPEPPTPSPADWNRLTYSGHEFDPETALYYYKARFYDPELGRFASEDPYLGDSLTPPSLHRYLYANANPLLYVDLTGYAAFLTEKVSTLQHQLPTAESNCHQNWKSPLHQLLKRFNWDKAQTKEYLDELEKNKIGSVAFILVEKGDTPEKIYDTFIQGRGYARQLHFLKTALQQKAAGAQPDDLLDVTTAHLFADDFQNYVTSLNADANWKTTLAGAFDEWVQGNYQAAKSALPIESGGVFDKVVDYSLLPASGGYLIARDFLKGVNEEFRLGLDPNQPLETRVRNLTKAAIDVFSVAVGVQQLGKQAVASGARMVASRHASEASTVLPELPEGYHYRSVGGQTHVVRNPGKAGELPQLHLENGVLKLGPSPSIPRSQATRAAYLRQEANNPKLPRWMKPWLEKGEEPPGFRVHHKKALFDGGTDTIDNLVLQAEDLHVTIHRYYRPGGRIPSISPPLSKNH